MIRILLTVLAIGLATQPLAETRVPASQSEIALGFAPVVKRSAPAVVNIYAKIITEGRANPLFSDPFFRDFFGGRAAPRPQVRNSLGSGVILSPDGFVVSNYHVVGMASEIRVVTTDRREFDATVVLADEETDIAILKLAEARDLPHLNLRDSDHVEVGELALAIGNPFGVGQTVSSGIVSGLARTGTATGNARGYFIQTDAAINPGNSGGALIDVNGDLIGINTSILTRSGGSNGIGFAVPANLVAEFLRQAQAGNPEFVRPWAGMTGQSMTADIAESLGLDPPMGFVVADLHKLSPFAAAGFRAGDVITHMDGQEVNSPPEMMFRMSVAGIGGSSVVTRIRDGRAEEAEVSMIAAPDEPPAQRTMLDDGTILPGLVLARANPAVIADLGLPISAEGVVVVDPGRYGARAGLRRGDQIAAVNGAAIEAPADAEALLRDPGRWLQLDVLRQGKRLSLRFRL
ncbi:Do/DeqQ family serine protease [Cribrihabitans marinus]|uniref:Do/DeqQ family serine protease n=1 Tax=Cribrihabitans marinus TaxID=1227549 RepID=A0A1H7DVJ9_9RHOB|nr:trypsin-like peptidase domain-containing protein [Cribrihabitans marinus]GGH40689.1 serine protease [Cribrihabitans marinus]SEK05766.1 Do/DeqQ family serine protease [Cribrihabitans marinus]